MFFEIVTFVILAITLATKWSTSRSIQGMKLERVELENEYSKLRTNYDKLFETRKTAEEQAKGLEAEIDELKEALEETRTDLDNQIDRNEELGR